MTQINKKNNILYIIRSQVESHIMTQINKKNIFCFPCKNACNADSNVLYYRRGQGKPTTIQAAAVKRTKGKTMENFDYIKAENIIDRMIGSWEEQGSYYGKLPLSNRINADNHYTMLRKKLVSIAETYGIDFLMDLDYRMKYVFEERTK